MLFRSPILLAVFLCSDLALAQDEQPLDLEDPRPLIMQPGYNLDMEFEQDNSELTNIQRQPGGDGITEKCMKLRREYDSLKGKPQRRWAYGTL